MRKNDMQNREAFHICCSSLLGFPLISSKLTCSSENSRQNEIELKMTDIHPLMIFDNEQYFLMRPICIYILKFFVLISWIRIYMGYQIPYYRVFRILVSHLGITLTRGPGSIPGMGKVIFCNILKLYYYMIWWYLDLANISLIPTE